MFWKIHSIVYFNHLKLKILAEMMNVLKFWVNTRDAVIHQKLKIHILNMETFMLIVIIICCGTKITIITMEFDLHGFVITPINLWIHHHDTLQHIPHSKIPKPQKKTNPLQLQTSDQPPSSQNLFVDKVLSNERTMLKKKC